jgi:hypothetical protein
MLRSNHRISVMAGFQENLRQAEVYRLWVPRSHHLHLKPLALPKLRDCLAQVAADSRNLRGVEEAIKPQAKPLVTLIGTIVLRKPPFASPRQRKAASDATLLEMSRGQMIADTAAKVHKREPCLLHVFLQEICTMPAPPRPLVQPLCKTLHGLLAVASLMQLPGGLKGSSQLREQPSSSRLLVQVSAGVLLRVEA